jgi:type I restriction enzyme S subunit
MVNDWVEKSLADICNLIKRGVTPKYSDEGVLVINQRCIRDQRISLDAARRHDLNLRKISDEKFLQGGDVLINSTGVGTLGRVAQVNNISEKTTVDTHVTIARLGLFSEIDISFFGCILKYKEPVFEAMGEGSTGQTELSRHLVGDVLVRYPKSKDEQKAIAHILGSLDDKIELNRQMNETLEAMAQALFKSWFVDFDPVIDNALAAGNAIPDEFMERAEQRKAIEKKDNSEIQSLFPNEFEFTEEMGWIPRGWEVNKLGGYIEVKRGGSPRPIHDYLVPEGLPWVKISDATASNSRFLVETKQFIKPEGLKKTTLLNKGSLILSNSATPGLPKFLDLDACIHDGWLHFPKKTIFTDNYLYQLFLVVRQELLMQGNGSVFTNLKTDILKNHMVVVPNIDILNYFDNWIISFHNKIHAVQTDLDNLSKLRDTLLPKLMSGELRISDATKILDEAI